LERKEDLNIIYQNIVNKQSIGIQCTMLRITRIAISTLSKIYFYLRNNWLRLSKGRLSFAIAGNLDVNIKCKFTDDVEVEEGG